MSGRFMKRNRKALFQRRKIASSNIVITEQNGIEDCMAYIGISLVLLIYIAINFYALIGLLKRFRVDRFATTSLRGDHLDWGGGNMSSGQLPLVIDNMTKVTSAVLRATEESATASPVAEKAAELLFKREYEESEESFYFNFYSKFHQYSQQDSNLLRILPHYTYIHHVSRPYNQWSMEHKNNNASLLKASIPTDMSAVEGFARLHGGATGRSVPYGFNYSEYATSGAYFAYDHSGYGDRCLLHSISLKLVEECGDTVLTKVKSNRKFCRSLLIAAAQRSGTHYTWEMLNRLKMDFHHEGLGQDGGIGWIFSVNSFPVKAREHLWGKIQAFGELYAINNPEKLTLHRFRHIFHQVRHPLRVVSTLYRKCHNWDRFWKWISKLKGFEIFHSRLPGKRRAMLLYLLWNRHIEAYADLRFRTETTSPRDICRWAELNITKCTMPGGTGEGILLEPASGVIRYHPNLTSQPPRVNSTYHSYSGLSWKQLEEADPVLAFELKVMCVEYGFPLDPNLLPQNAETSQFSA